MCEFGWQHRRKKKIRIYSPRRNPCDTTFHPIKEVKVLFPSVWFTRKKEREGCNVATLCTVMERRKEYLIWEYTTEKKKNASSFSCLVENYTFWWADAQLPQWSSGDNSKFMDFIAKVLSQKKNRLGHKCATEVQMYLIAW